MDRLIQKSFEDILQAIDEIDIFFQERSRRFDVFQSDILLRKAILMNISIIGEAMNRILKIDPEINISSSRKIVNTRNYIIHGYDSLQDDIIWSIVIRHLPILKKEILEILN